MQLRTCQMRNFSHAQLGTKSGKFLVLRYRDKACETIIRLTVAGPQMHVKHACMATQYAPAVQFTGQKFY